MAALVGDKHAARAKLEDEVELPKAAKRSVFISFAKRDEASRLVAEAENAVRDAALELSKSMSLRDVGTVLGVTRQRAPQLVSDTHRKAAGPIARTKAFFDVGGFARAKPKAQKATRGQKTAS